MTNISPLTKLKFLIHCFCALACITTLYATDPDPNTPTIITYPAPISIDYPSSTLGTNFPITFVTIGDAGNAPDDSAYNYGSVAEPYRLQQNNTSIAEYCQFLNAVAKDGDPFELYDERMYTDATVHAIERKNSTPPYLYVPVTGQETNPICYVDWSSAARFCNWLQNGCGGPETTETGAYTMQPGPLKNQSCLATNPGAIYFLATPNQWHKASYYQGGGLNAGYFDRNSVFQSNWAGAYGIYGLGMVNGITFIEWLTPDETWYGPFSNFPQVNLPWECETTAKESQLGFRVASPVLPSSQPITDSPK